MDNNHLNKSIKSVAIIILTAGLLLLLIGCSLKTQKKVLIEPEDISHFNEDVPYLKAHMKNGDLYIFEFWKISDDDKSISGSGQHFDANRDVIPEYSFEIPIDSVTIFESNKVQTSGAVAALTVLTGITVAVTAYCISNPKACFGSCPTFYANINNDEKLLAEGFSSSITPILEREDIDILNNLTDNNGVVTITMKNEALETHVVRSVDLLAFPPIEQPIFYTTEKNFQIAEKLYSPISCTSDSLDCLDNILTMDGNEHFSLADSTYLGEKEFIELTFDELPNSSAGIIIGTRQTLLSTYLFYQALAYMGTEASAWLSKLERADKSITEKIKGVGIELGGIEVLIPDENGDYYSAGVIRETGPLATDIHLLKLPDLPADCKNIKLQLTRGHWRIDYIALAKLGGQIEPIVIKPSEIKFNLSDENNAVEQLTDDSQQLITYPGHEYTISYHLPKDYWNGSFYLKSQGYYLEWIREEWLEEEDQTLAMLMFFDPDGSLRRLAADYKEVEREMEDYFWGSRYAK